MNKLNNNEPNIEPFGIPRQISDDFLYDFHYFLERLLESLQLQLSLRARFL